MSEREHKIANAIETYFSDASLLWDKVMVSKILADPSGMVSIEAICKLAKLKALQASPNEVLEAIEKHSLSRLKVSDDKEKVGRIKPYVNKKTEELDEWSIYVEGLSKPYSDEHSIRELFNQLVGHVSFFRIPLNRKGEQQFFGYCFIEFDDRNNVEKAIELLNSYPKRKRSAIEETDPNKLKLLNRLNLRVMSKLDWIKLKDEYVKISTEKREFAEKAWAEYYKLLEEQENTIEEKKEEKGYTEGLIVFVDNLHPSSPKTIAISLLETSGVRIAFMNIKKKGLTSTHIRLNTPEDAKKICDYFNEHYIVQDNEKDKDGKQVEARTNECIKLRVITGSEERIYWENDQKK